MRALTDGEAEFYIQAAFRAFLGREVDEEGLRYWRSVLRKGQDPLDIVRAVVASVEYAQAATGDRGVLTEPILPDAAIDWPLLRQKYLYGDDSESSSRLGFVRKLARRIRWVLVFPLLQLGADAQMRVHRDAQVLLARQIGFLSAWAAHLSAPLEAVAALQPVVDQMVKDRMVLAQRLMCI